MKTFIAECQRRRVFRMAALYIIGAWIVLQVADLAFDNWGIPSEAMRYVWIGCMLGFPIALFLGWRFDVIGGRVVRTPDTDDNVEVPLRRTDHIILSTVAVIVVAITIGLLGEISGTRTSTPDQDRVDDIDPRSIAVLPFTDMSPEGDQAYFSDGIAEELLNLLAKYQGLRVISRSSSFALRDASLSIPEVAEKLRVAHVLEGSVRKAGNRVRVTAQLIEARTDTHLWSETYDRELDDVFAIQDQISAQVVQELKVRLLGPAPSAGITDTAAYDSYLQGLSLLTKRGEDNLRQAMAHFEQVIATDPDYAPAHASLALTLVWSNFFISESHLLGEAAAQRALELDPGNSDALAALGLIRDDQGRADEAREAFERAIVRNPNNALAYRWLGRSYIDADPPRYYALARKAYAVDPLDPTIQFHLSVTASAFGRYDEALAAARELLTRGQEWLGYPVAINLYRSTGRLDRSVKTSFAAYRAVPKTWGYQPIVFTLIDLNELSLAETWLREVKRQTGEDDTHTKAVLTFRLGRPEEAILLFVDALDRGEIPGQELAFFIVRMKRDYVRAREVYEQGFANMGQEIPRFDPSLWWPWYIDYALALQHTGEPERADELIREIKGFIDTQLANGVVLGPAGLHLQFLLAQVHAIDGDVQPALTALRKAMQDGFTCTGCLHDFPHFDSMRGEQAYAALIADLEASNDAQRQRLVDEGMLLTPEEVLALEDFSFDPFEY